jgi:ribose-phosphate pyrophosphokinase
MTALFMLTQYFADQHSRTWSWCRRTPAGSSWPRTSRRRSGAELAILNKERPAQQVAEIGYVIGDVSGAPRSWWTT